MEKSKQKQDASRCHYPNIWKKTKQTDFKLKQVRETINQDDIIILNIYAPNSGAPDFIGSILLEL